MGFYRVVILPETLISQTHRTPKRQNAMSHHLAFGSSPSSLSMMMSFVLSGRITLSEHLPGEVINVPITTAQRSSHLREMIKKDAITNSANKQIKLPGVDCIGFRMYVDWLESRNIDFDTTPTTSNGGLLLRDCFDYIFAHIAGSQLGDPDFQDYVIDTMARLLDESQTPDLKVLEVVFLEKGASNILKQFVVDSMFAVERKMLSMMRGVVDDSDNIAQSDAGCKYHVHEGECYRTRVNSGHDRTANVPEIVHGKFNLGNINRVASQSKWSSSSTSLDSNSSTKTAFYDMANAQYFGSEEWSREVHGLGRITRLNIDKPLPTIPPLTPEISPTSPDSPQTTPHIVPDRLKYEDFSIEELIHECLRRLPPRDSPKSRSEDPPELHHAIIPSLVLECIERYHKASSDSASSHLSHSPDRLSLEERRASTPFPEQEEILIVDVMSKKRHVHWGRSSESLPKPWQEHMDRHRISEEVFEPQHEPPATSRRQRPAAPRHTRLVTPQHAHPIPEYQSCPPPQFIPTTHHPQVSPPNMIKRKSAPPRGDDWLKQYDRLNTMMSTNALVVVAKRSKKSRFKEILRTESGMSV
jgi:hypothetical protein